MDNTGAVLQGSDATGVVVTNGTRGPVRDHGGFVAVVVLQSTFSYAADLLPTQATGPNGDTSSTGLRSVRAAFFLDFEDGGCEAVTCFYYLNSPASVYAYTNPANNAVGRVAEDDAGRVWADDQAGVRDGDL